jgi:DnaK suppressor protein
MLTKSFLKKTKERLLKARDELVEKSTQRSDIDTEGDETDAVQGNVLIDIQNQLSSRDNQKLTQINAALKSIDDKTYGICDDCEENIPEKRLEVNPYVSICVSCAEEREAEDKQRKRF